MKLANPTVSALVQPMLPGATEVFLSDAYENYDLTITDASLPEIEINHARGSMADGLTTATAVDLAVFDFQDADGDGVDDDGSVFIVPLAVDPTDPTTLADGPVVTDTAAILDTDGSTLGSLSLDAPAYMFDGEICYTLNIGLEASALYNFAFIIDVSGSMDIDDAIIDGVTVSRLEAAQAAYADLIAFLQAEGVADVSSFSVVDFDTTARLTPNLTADEAAAKIASLTPLDFTNLGGALDLAEGWFESVQTVGRTNIAYVLSDGFANRGPTPSASLQLVKEGLADEAVVDVRAFGTGNPDIATLNVVDTNSAEILTNAGDLRDAFTTGEITADDIDRIDVLLDGVKVDEIDPTDLTAGALGLSYSGKIDGLSVAPDAENEVTFEVVFSDGTPTADITATVTTGQETTITTLPDGTNRVVLGVNDGAYTGDDSNEEVIGNDGDNVIDGLDGLNELFGNGGDDTFNISGGTNVIVGGDGVDTVVFGVDCATAGDIVVNGDVITIGDDVTVTEVEFLEFTDKTIDVDDLISPPTGDIIGTDDADVLMGTPDEDVIRALAGDDLVIAKRSDDKLYGGDGEDILYGGMGDDMIFGGDQNDNLHGRADNDMLEGGKGSDLLLGEKGDDQLFGGMGFDKLSGALGDDVLTGGLGDDVFRMKGFWGTDTVTDFTLGEDSVRIYGATFADLSITQNGANAEVAFDAARLILENVDVADLGVDNFIFG